MRTSPVRVLVVDDFAPWRQLIHSILEEKPELQVVCEVGDGWEAVQKAQELQPDLILLDIGLPTLNGIEAARQIRNLAPKSNILFVSENYSVDIAREAFRVGGCGYVIKSDAGSELLPAVEAVMLGHQFISARMVGHSLFAGTNAPALDRLRIKEILASFAPRLPRNQGTTRCHQVQFYSDDVFFLDNLARFVGAGLSAGRVVVALATEPHRDRFVEGLQAYGLDIRAAIQQGSYILSDVSEAISTFIVNDSLDPVRYLEGMADLVESALRPTGSEHRRVAVCGELAAPLLAQGKTEALIQIEQLSSEFASEYPLDILCNYPVTSFPKEEAGQIRQRICAEHSTVYSQ